MSYHYAAGSTFSMPAEYKDGTIHPFTSSIPLLDKSAWQGLKFTATTGILLPRAASSLSWKT